MKNEILFRGFGGNWEIEENLIVFVSKIGSVGVIVMIVCEFEIVMIVFVIVVGIESVIVVARGIGIEMMDNVCVIFV